LLIALKKLGTCLSVRLCLVHCFILFSKANTVLFSPQILKKICNHPLLLTKKAAEDILEGMDEMVDDQDIGMVRKLVMNLADMVHDDDALEVGQDVSCKLSFIMTLLRNLVEEGHHVLIFSQTCKMLNLIQVCYCYFNILCSILL